MRKNKKAASESGFVLPMTLLLILMLMITGLGFNQLNFHEYKLTMHQHDNENAFYLASAGIERARETFKIPDSLSWSSILDGTNVNYPEDTSVNELCPDPSYGCIIPPFQTKALNSTYVTTDGQDISNPDFPFSNIFDQGQYSVRAYNNTDDPNAAIDKKSDGDQVLTLRASGLVRGQKKIIQVNIVATSGMKLINCKNSDPSAPCPDSKNDNSQIIAIPGREPASTPSLPTFNDGFYRDIANLPCTSQVKVSGNMDLSDNTNGGSIAMQSNTCYFATGDISVKNVGGTYSNIVIFSDKNLSVNSGPSFSNTVLIGLNEIQLQGSVTTSAPTQMPALVSNGSIVKGDANVNITGNIYAGGSIGSDQHPWNPNQVEGSIIGGDVFLKAASTVVTDAGKDTYYQFMKGFSYSQDLKYTSVVASSWKEIQ